MFGTFFFKQNKTMFGTLYSKFEFCTMRANIGHNFLVLRSPMQSYI